MRPSLPWRTGATAYLHPGRPTSSRCDGVDSGQASTAARLAALGRHEDHIHAAKAQAHAAHDQMAHDMGHGAGMDMTGMVRDMRNRFWICLVFTIPIFLYAPMGMQIPMPAPPFGLGMNQWLFLLASAAILYPSWPFFVSAWRALQDGTLNMATLVVLSVGTGYLFSVGATFSLPGSSSMRPRPSCWYLSCWDTGWRCEPVPVHRTLSVH